MVIEQTGATLLRRFRIPEKNIDLALVRSGYKFDSSVLTLYKNSGIPGTNLDSFSKIAEKKFYSEGGNIRVGFTPEKICRSQFNDKGEIIGHSVVMRDKNDGYLSVFVNDKSVKMSNARLEVTDGKPKVSIGKYDGTPFNINFVNDKLTPMAKRVLKLFNQAINK